jgi:antagonist of KipI
MTLRVVQPGLYTLAVDFGRPASRSLGIPVGGAADRTSLALANALVGNAPDTVGLEFTLAGPTLGAECDLACAVVGAPFDLSVGLRRLKINSAFTLAAGEVLRVGGTARGARAYFAVRGGLEVPLVLGSRSGLAPMSAGDVLPCRPGRTPERFIRREEGGHSVTLRAVAGPQADWFDVGAFFGREFAVSGSGNRMGLRLVGPALPVAGREMVSEPVCPGAVQVTRDGGCIVLGVDGQTIGGYPRVAQVIAADLDKVGQLRPGDATKRRRPFGPSGPNLGGG